MIEPASATRVLILAADPLTRSGLSALLAAQGGVRPVAQVAAPGDLRAALDVYRPDVVLWDCSRSAEAVPDAILNLAASETTTQIAPLGQRSPHTAAVVALAADAEQGRLLWQMGLRCVLLRSLEARTLAAALVAAAAGVWVLAPELAGGIALLRDESWAGDLEPLTERELQVLQLMAEGLANRAIAHRLDISEHTVKFHINAIFGKLGVQSRTAAVVRATRAGLVLL